MISEHGRLGGTEVAEVLALIGAVVDADGVSPVSEHALLHLRHGGDRDAHNLLLRNHSGVLAGYAHLDATDLVEGASAELAVHPEHREQGHGAALVGAVERRTRDGRLRLWAHGRHPGAEALARAFGYEQSRVLWQMRKSLLAHLPHLPVPEGFGLRAFVVGQDEQAWTELNNRAFAEHPDQGGWSLTEIHTREKEPWFDPAGFLLAERDSDRELVGFHWTKVHGGVREPGHGHDHDPLGEVYVVGVDPSVQGQGLGPALTVAGLRYLRGRGLAQVMLYVDESNTAAIRVYERLGFIRWDVDVSYRRTSRRD